MSLGFILLIASGVLVLFGAGQRVLDRMRLTDREAILFIALIIAGGFLPDIWLSRSFAFNVGGALVPLGLCAYLWFKADTFLEKARSIAAALLTGVAVYVLGRVLPADPAEMVVDPTLVYGAASGLIAYVFGRSRRGAFIAGTLGVMLANLAAWGYANAQGADQALVLGGAGGFDVIVLSGLIAVLLSELVGELIERAKRGRQKPTREFVNGDFVRREQR